MDLQSFGPTRVELPKDYIHQDGFWLLVKKTNNLAPNTPSCVTDPCLTSLSDD